MTEELTADQRVIVDGFGIHNPEALAWKAAWWSGRCMDEDLTSEDYGDLGGFLLEVKNTLLEAAAHEALECRIKSYVTTNYHDAVVGEGQRQIHTLESRVAAALEIADGMCSMDRHYGMTIEGRGEVIRAALTGAATEGKNLWEAKPDGRVGPTEAGVRVWNRTTEIEE